MVIKITVESAKWHLTDLNKQKTEPDKPFQWSRHVKGYKQSYFLHTEFLETDIWWLKFTIRISHT